MPQLFLTPQEIDELTDRHGKHRRVATQRAALRAMGIEHRVRPDGSIAVLRAHVENLLGAPDSGKVPDAQPNFEALHA